MWLLLFILLLQCVGINIKKHVNAIGVSGTARKKVWNFTAEFIVRSKRLVLIAWFMIFIFIFCAVKCEKTGGIKYFTCFLIFILVVTCFMRFFSCHRLGKINIIIVVTTKMYWNFNIFHVFLLSYQSYTSN